MKTMLLTIAVAIAGWSCALSQSLPKASVSRVTKTNHLTIYTVVAPPEMFSNTTHIIELPHELIVIDGQFFAPYAQEVKQLTDSLKKPITRFYISHGHPDHYIGFGDAFPTVAVYALPETKAEIDKEGLQTLQKRQQQFGGVIARSLNPPTHLQKEGEELIDGVRFVFEKSLNNETAASLVIKMPEANTYIAQDIVYNKTHLFISGNTDGWRKAIKRVANDSQYTLILPGHGNPANRSVLDDDLAYFDFVDKALAESSSKEEYKAKLLAAYPGYGGVHLIDIYLTFLKNDWRQTK